MNEEDKEVYANWLLNECETPIDEIIELLNNLDDKVIEYWWHPNKNKNE